MNIILYVVCYGVPHPDTGHLRYHDETCLRRVAEKLGRICEGHPEHIPIVFDGTPIGQEAAHLIADQIVMREMVADGDLSPFHIKWKLMHHGIKSFLPEVPRTERRRVIFVVPKESSKLILGVLDGISDHRVEAGDTFSYEFDEYRVCKFD